ncbi:hypothetical protein GCM10023198_55860 [Promicromonospora umidemergens]|uniref:Uncharacterized protein n=1 Tax=Promicromonospora umidemergens TaxID=629679 RepID=A0ABP8Y7X2_9MICO
MRRRPAGKEGGSTHGPKLALPCDTDDETSDAQGNDPITQQHANQPPCASTQGPGPELTSVPGPIPG